MPVSGDGDNLISIDCVSPWNDWLQEFITFGTLRINSYLLFYPFPRKVSLFRSKFNAAERSLAKFPRQIDSLKLAATSSKSVGLVDTFSIKNK